MQIEQILVSSSKYSLKCPNVMTPKYITIHNTYNDAPAINEINYMIGNSNSTSFHVAVDDVRAIQGIPFNRNAWHCGDGSGPGNMQSIGVEICYSLSGGSRYYKAEDNAAQVIAQLMKQFGIPLSNVRTHQSWSGKYCPHRMLDEGRLNGFLAKVKAAFDGGTVAPPTSGGSSEGIGTVTITGTGINLRKGPGTGYAVIRQLNAPESYIVWAEKDGWLNLGGDQWIKYDGSYMNYVKNSAPEVGKLAVVKVNGLWVYNAPDWNAKEKQVNAGEAFTILDVLTVDGSKMFKCKYFYITAWPEYVEVR